MEDYIIEVFNKCCEHYGLSKFKRDYPSLCIKHDEEDLLSGEYCAENNDIEHINKKLRDEQNL